MWKVMFKSVLGNIRPWCYLKILGTLIVGGSNEVYHELENKYFLSCNH